jgi:predicted secreted protein
MPGAGYWMFPSVQVDNNYKTLLEMLRYLLLLFVLLNSSIACCQNDTILITGNTPVLNVKENEPFALKFLACHDGGYHWFLEKTDTAKVKLINVSSRHTSGRTDMVGGNVYEFWLFKVVSGGTYVLDFIYKRPWLKEEEKAYRVELHVN